jgi:phosphoglycerate dehydrogenase-like enzyme
MPTVILSGLTASFNQGRLERLLTTAWRIVAVPDESDSRILLKALGDADALIGLRWRGDWGETATRLRLIQALGAGVDAYDQNALPPGCSLCNVYEHGVPVAEYVIGVMAALTMRFGHYDRLLRSGRWDGSGRLDGETHAELAGQSVGLIGWGGIGREVARRARAFDMKVYAIRANPAGFSDSPEELRPDWQGGPDQLEELLGAVDFLIACCPLNEQTRGLLNRRKLALLRPTAYLINVARAEIIDEDALYDALRSRKIAGAALDVWYRYPSKLEERLLPASRPFHELENVLMTPHLSAWTEAMIERRWRVIAANLDALAEGRPLKNVVSPLGTRAS